MTAKLIKISDLQLRRCCYYCLKRRIKCIKLQILRKTGKKVSLSAGAGRLYMVLVREELFQIVANLVEKLFHGIAVAAFDNRL